MIKLIYIKYIISNIGLEQVGWLSIKERSRTWITVINGEGEFENENFDAIAEIRIEIVKSCWKLLIINTRKRLRKIG